MNIGFTGTQKGMTDEQQSVLKKIFYKLKPVSFHHGCCIGADHQAGQIADSIPIANIILHPPINTSKMAKCIGDVTRQPKEYLDRNHDIVDETNILVGTPKEYIEELRSGTWATIRYAKKNNKPVIIIYPDGNIERFN